MNSYPYPSTAGLFDENNRPALTDVTTPFAQSVSDVTQSLTKSVLEVMHGDTSVVATEASALAPRAEGQGQDDNSEAGQQGQGSHGDEVLAPDVLVDFDPLLMVEEEVVSSQTGGVMVVEEGEGGGVVLPGVQDSQACSDNQMDDVSVGDDHDDYLSNTIARLQRRAKQQGRYVGGLLDSPRQLAAGGGHDGAKKGKKNKAPVVRKATSTAKRVHKMTKGKKEDKPGYKMAGGHIKKSARAGKGGKKTSQDFVCEACYRPFLNKSNMRRHQRRFHTSLFSDASVPTERNFDDVNAPSVTSSKSNMMQSLPLSPSSSSSSAISGAVSLPQPKARPRSSDRPTDPHGQQLYDVQQPTCVASAEPDGQLSYQHHEHFARGDYDLDVSTRALEKKYLAEHIEQALRARDRQLDNTQDHDLENDQSRSAVDKEKDLDPESGSAEDTVGTLGRAPEDSAPRRPRRCEFRVKALGESELYMATYDGESDESEGASSDVSMRRTPRKTGSHDADTDSDSRMPSGPVKKKTKKKNKSSAKKKGRGKRRDKDDEDNDDGQEEEELEKDKYLEDNKVGEKGKGRNKSGDERVLGRGKKTKKAKQSSSGDHLGNAGKKNKRCLKKRQEEEEEEDDKDDDEDSDDDDDDDRPLTFRTKKRTRVNSTVRTPDYTLTHPPTHSTTTKTPVLSRPTCAPCFLANSYSCSSPYLTTSFCSSFCGPAITTHGVVIFFFFCVLPVPRRKCVCDRFRFPTV
jgi:hypothetical protein